MNKPHTFCQFCGARHVAESFPRACGACSGVTYANPVPVVVVMVPVGDGLLVGRRGINPAKGKLAHTAGYMELGETWQQSAARELEEETGLRLPADVLRLYDVTSAGNGNLLLFCTTPPLVASAFDGFTPNDEVTELTVITEPTELAFETHTKMAERYFEVLKARTPNPWWR